MGWITKEKENKWIRQSEEVSFDKNEVKKIAKEKFERLQKSWAKELTPDEKFIVYRNLIYRETKGKNVPITNEEINKLARTLSGEKNKKSSLDNKTEWIEMFPGGKLVFPSSLNKQSRTTPGDLSLDISEVIGKDIYDKKTNKIVGKVLKETEYDGKFFNAIIEDEKLEIAFGDDLLWGDYYVMVEDEGKMVPSYKLVEKYQSKQSSFNNQSNPKKVTKEYNVYKFDELSEEGKEKVLEKHRDINVDNEEWSDGIIDEWRSKLEGQGFNNVEIAYSGFWSQGDGASFTAKSLDVDKIIKSLGLKASKELLEEASAGEIDGEVKRTTTMYVHENTTSVFLGYHGENEKVNNEVADLEKQIQEYNYKTNKEIYNELDKAYEYLTSDEQVIETIKSNDYEFTEDGKIFASLKKNQINKQSDYQGWKNYETWAVALWIDNDQGLYNMITEQAEIFKKETDEAKFKLADYIKDTIEEMNPLTDTATLFTDLLNAALGEVDWYEVAEHHLEV